MNLERTIHSETIVRRASEVAFSQLDDELFAIDVQGGYCYSLNEPAGRIWALIATPSSVGSVCAQLRKEYVVDEVTCLEDVIALLASLHSAGLVQVSDAPAT